MINLVINLLHQHVDMTLILSHVYRSWQCFTRQTPSPTTWLVFILLYVCPTWADSSGSISLQTEASRTKLWALTCASLGILRGDVVCLHLGCVDASTVTVYREIDSLQRSVFLPGQKRLIVKWELASSPVNHVCVWWFPALLLDKRKKEKQKSQGTSKNSRTSVTSAPQLTSKPNVSCGQAQVFIWASRFSETFQHAARDLVIPPHLHCEM